MIKKRFQKIAVYLTAVLSFVICGFLYSCTNRRETGYIIEQPESIGGDLRYRFRCVGECTAG